MSALSIDELRLAWRRMRLDRPDRVFVSHPEVLAWIETNLNDWFLHVQQQLSASRIPHASRLCLVPKAADLLRPATILDLEDELVYNALVGRFLLNICGILADLQGRPDVSNQLQADPRVPLWVRKGFKIWRQWRENSSSLLEEETAYVVFTDITGFYDNIDLTRLFSDLRSVAVTEDDVSLLAKCLKKWSYPRDKGIPQGYSASDVLAKLYLSPLDRGLINEGIVHLRYVDDIRVFCTSRLEARRVIRRLTHLLHQRGLTLQSAKTKIKQKQEARSEIDGITPLIEGIQKQLLDELQADLKQAGPYPTPGEMTLLREEHNGPPIEVLERALHDNFSVGGGTVFHSSLFHFLLPRLGVAKSRAAVEYGLDVIRTHPEETDHILRYFTAIQPGINDIDRLAAYMASEDALHDYQRFQLLRWFCETDVYSNKVAKLARQWVADANCEPWLRSYSLAYLGRFGDVSDLDLIEQRFLNAATDLERAECLAALRRQERGRRNALYAASRGEGLLVRRAIDAVKSSGI